MDWQYNSPLPPFGHGSAVQPGFTPSPPGPAPSVFGPAPPAPPPAGPMPPPPLPQGSSHLPSNGSGYGATKSSVGGGNVSSGSGGAVLAASTAPATANDTAMIDAPTDDQAGKYQSAATSGSGDLRETSDGVGSAGVQSNDQAMIDVQRNEYDQPGSSMQDAVDQQAPSYQQGAGGVSARRSLVPRLRRTPRQASQYDGPGSQEGSAADELRHIGARALPLTARGGVESGENSGDSCEKADGEIPIGRGEDEDGGSKQQECEQDKGEEDDGDEDEEEDEEDEEDPDYVKVTGCD